MKYFSRIIIIALLTLAPLAKSQADSHVTATIDSVQMLIGEQTGLHLKATVKKGQSVQFPDYRPLDYIAPGVEVVEAPVIDTTAADNGFVNITQHYVLTAFEDSLYYIPALKVLIDGKEYSSKNLALKVLTVEVDTLHPENFYPPKGVMDNPFLWSEWSCVFWCAVLAMLLYVLCWLAYFRLKSNKPIKLRVRFVKRIPPHKRALQAIDDIKKEGVPANEKAYYTQLTDTLRKYMEERFGFNAMEMTTAEIIAALREKGDQEKLQELAMLFETADLVKFAKYTVGMSENDRNLVSAIDFINTTKQENQPTVERIVPTVTQQQKQTIRIRRVLKWGIVALAVFATALVAFACWQLYDLRF